jgi:hypothetical protein
MECQIDNNVYHTTTRLTPVGSLTVHEISGGSMINVMYLFISCIVGEPTGVNLVVV